MNFDNVSISILCVAIILLVLGCSVSWKKNQQLKTTLDSISPKTDTFYQEESNSYADSDSTEGSSTDSTDSNSCWKYIPSLVRERCSDGNNLKGCESAREIWGGEGEDGIYRNYVKARNNFGRMVNGKYELNMEEFADFFEVPQTCYNLRDVHTNYSEEDVDDAKSFIKNPANSLYLHTTLAKTYDNYENLDNANVVSAYTESTPTIDISEELKKMGGPILGFPDAYDDQVSTNPSGYMSLFKPKVLAWNSWMPPHSSTHIVPPTNKEILDQGLHHKHVPVLTRQVPINPFEEDMINTGQINWGIPAECEQLFDPTAIRLEHTTSQENINVDNLLEARDFHDTRRTSMCLELSS